MKKYFKMLMIVGIFGLIVTGCTKLDYMKKEAFEKCKICEKEVSGKEPDYCDSCWEIKLKIEEEEKKEEEKKKMEEKAKEERNRCRDCKGKFVEGKAGQEERGLCFYCQAHYCYLCGEYISEEAFNDTCNKCEPKLYCKQCGIGSKIKDEMHTDINGDNICSECCEPRNGICVGCKSKAMLVNGICEVCHENIIEEYKKDELENRE